MRVKLLVMTAMLFTLLYHSMQLSICKLYEITEIYSAYTTTLDKGKLRQGITGIHLSILGKSIHPCVHSVANGGAAFDAGIEPGAYITKLDGYSTAAMSEQEWVKNLRGIAGTPITITLSDRDMGGTERDITVVRRPISMLKSRLEQYRMVQDDGGFMTSYSSRMPAFINKYHGMQILEFYDDKTGPSDVPPSLKHSEKCFSARHNEEKGVLIRRLNIKEPDSLAIAKRLQINSFPAYYFAPHGAWEPEPNRLESLPLLHKQYRPVCDHGVEAAPGQWTKIKTIGTKPETK